MRTRRNGGGAATDVSSRGTMGNVTLSAKGKLGVVKGKGIVNPVPTGVGDSLQNMKNQNIMDWKRKEASAAATNIGQPSVKGSATTVVGRPAPSRSSKTPNKVVPSLATASVAESVDEHSVRESVSVGSALSVGG